MGTKTVLAVALAGSAILCSAPASADNYETQSGRVLCAVTPDSSLALVGPYGLLPSPPTHPYDAVVCQGEFTQPGAGEAAATIGNGSFFWQNGANLAVL